ncbi:MAG: molybdopterin-guanine dinucleotide biosynthesis protein B [Betaproteobacteria bacterium]|nr:molybdopterin-guanine dinucleotide biosynthesis protein B [Betaproteobacteria bacterium]
MKVFGIAGYSGSGKTTLLEKLLPRFVALGLRVSVIKHTHHDFDIDKPGKDSYRHREAGASEVLIASGTRWVLMNELRGAPEPALDEYLGRFSPCDLVLVEGFKQENIPKLEVYRPASGRPPLWPDNPNVVAVACDAPEQLPTDLALPVLDLNDPEAIVRYILETLNMEGDAPC